MYCSCILVGAGKGTRFSSCESKTEALIYGLPVYVWALRSMLQCDFIMEIVLVGPFCLEKVLSFFPQAEGKIRVVPGGLSRTESVWKGLRSCKKDASFVCIHDVARPFIPRKMIQNLYSAVKMDEIDCAIPILPIYDSLKFCQNDISERTVPKRNVVRTQTPQFFKKKSLVTSFERYQQNIPIAEDETEVLKATFPSARIQCIPGSFYAEKITDKNSKKMVENLFSASNKVGFGWDFHPFQENRQLVLGGCFIEDHIGLEGDSDGDVVCHAIVDAILGAMGKGDIGSYFGVKTPSMMGVRSITLLSKLRQTDFSFFWEILNIDITIVAKKPILLDYIPQMKKNICDVLLIPKNKLNIKATTDKNMDDAGKGKGIRAVAVANLSIMEDWND